MSRKFLCLVATLLFVTFFNVTRVQAAGGKKDADIEAADPLKGLTVPPAIKLQMFTSGRQVTNPVAFCFDDQNRLYVACTNRYREGGGLDIRSAKFMFFDDMCLTTPEARRAMYAKYKDKYATDYFTKNKEKIYLLEESNGSGKADKVTLFAEGFNDAIDGPGVGISYHDGRIQYSSIPKIWELTDTKGAGIADKTEVLADGLGVHVGISGHDLHGLVWGPDGKLYFSIGDRGYNVTSKEGKHFYGPHEGGVFRCNPDGSDFEVYYFKLRNPQELAFDDYGNLFTCDNNADIGDKSRFVYILEGGSSGWTNGWQLLRYGDFAKLAGLGGTKPDPWLVERMWDMRHEGQPQHILPPVGLITSGPCGLAFHPGIGIAEGYARHFFVCDYTAGNNSGVQSMTADETGAGFEMKDAKHFIWGATITDIDFGYDGKMYVCDYGGGWYLSGKGRIFTAFDPAYIAKPEVAALRKIFSTGFAKLSASELTELLKHVDMRVRNRAHFELAKRGKDGMDALRAVAQTTGAVLPRLHGVWGLGILGRTEPEALKLLQGLLHDGDARVREQAAKMLGDARYAPAADELRQLLKDSNARVKTLAAIALGRIKHPAAVPALLQILRENDDKDLFLRHGASMGLAGCATPDELGKLSTDASKAVRLGALLTLRKLKDAHVAAFLKDADPLVYAEAIRASYDELIPEALHVLAAELPRLLAEKELHKNMTVLQYSRILNAAYRYGNESQADLVAKFAALESAPEESRLQALEYLEKWDTPTEFDPVIGTHHPVPKREKLKSNDVIRTALKSLMDGTAGQLAAKAVNLGALFGVEMSDIKLLTNLKNPQSPEVLRIAALEQLVLKQHKDVRGILPGLLKESSMGLRMAALDALLALDAPAGITAAREIMEGREAPAKELRVSIDRSTTDWNALSMGPPSKIDYADGSTGNHANFEAVKGFAQPHKDSNVDPAKLTRLNDGVGAENDDDVKRCVWQDGGESRMALDLKKSIEVAAINTYSWHKANRAAQNFVLWGSDAEKPDTEAKDLSKSKDWKRITEVNTEKLNDGGMHGSQIAWPGGVVGKFRWLLWQNNRRKSGTFYCEIDVYEKGQKLPLDVRLLHTQQETLLALGRAKTAAAADVLAEHFDKYEHGQLAKELQLELFEAAGLRTEGKIVERLAKLKAAWPAEDKLAPFTMALEGGDVKKGEDTFRNHAAACIRCHKIGQDGGDAGPNLAGVGKRLTREKILESLIDPSAVIVEGYGTSNYKLSDGRVVSGSVVEETKEKLVLKDVDGKVTTLNPSEIKRRSPATSPMPMMGEVLKPREIRDIIEFLYSLKVEAPKADAGKH